MSFELELTVTSADIDELGHAHNVRFVHWMSEAATQHSVAVGMPPDRYLARGEAFVVHRHEIDYLRPARLGEVLRIETRVLSIGVTRTERGTWIRSAARDETLAVGRSEWVYIRTTDGRPIRIPPDIRALFPCS